MLVPDGLEGGNDHVASVDVTWQGGGGVQGLIPLDPLCSVVNRELVGEYIPYFGYW